MFHDFTSLFQQAFPSSVIAPKVAWSPSNDPTPLDQATKDELAEIYAKPEKPRAMTGAERDLKYRRKKSKAKKENIGIIDFETDPFDNTRPDLKIEPFTACIYADQFEPIIIWENDFNTFIARLFSELEAIPEPFTFYAHNGGKFDFMFLMHKLRGMVQFKGRSLMSATIGLHELRDSFHIIPEKLANLQKDSFDYTKLTKRNREKHKAEIIRYMTNDCKYLLPFVKKFVEDFGFKISIGQAAMARLNKSYRWERISENTDKRLRDFFFGGRVECLQGLGRFTGDFKLYDVNSMYPFVMAERQHPIGREYIWRTGEPGRNTCFIELTCNSRGALVRRNIETGATEAPFGRYLFNTSIWEFDTAKRLGLISDIEIHACVDNANRSDFSRFIAPLYALRQHAKSELNRLEALGLTDEFEWNNWKKEDIFGKLLMNNSYGKFCQNPRKYKETIFTNWNEKPSDPDQSEAWHASWGHFPKSEHPDLGYSIWERPNPEWRFNNVGTGASITGAARAVLLEALFNAKNAVYCDTDSVICENLDNVEIDKVKLGAWDIEASEISEVIVTGKKQYSYRKSSDDMKPKIRAKGAASLKWDEMEKLLSGQTILNTQKGVTLLRTGKQFYMSRQIRATAPLLPRGGNYFDRLQMAAGPNTT